MAEGESITFYRQFANVMKAGAKTVHDTALRIKEWTSSTGNEDTLRLTDLTQDISLSKEDFLKACQAISERLKSTNTWFKHVFKIELVNEDNLCMTDKQFANREIRISIFGRHNCGKSILLNAILSSRLLPVSIHNETSAVVYIQHDKSRTHRGLHVCPGQVQQGAKQPVECQACPKLLVTKGDKTEGKVGVNEVYTELQVLNGHIRHTKPPIAGPTEERVHKEGKREVVGPKEKKLAKTEKAKGNSLFDLCNYKDAVLCYTRGMELDPLNEALPANRAMAFIRMKRYEDAEKDCSTALALSQNYIKAYYRRGLARKCLGRIEEARKDFKAMLILDPKNKTAKLELANLKKGNLSLCKLLVSVPALDKAPPGWEVLLVDTPGFGEANKRIAQVVDDALKSNTAFLYIMAGDSLGDACDMGYLRQLYETDKDVFTNDRLVIAVTKFDRNVEEGEESLEELEGKIKSKVAVQIKEEFEKSLSEDSIIPVSGLAAFSARCCHEGNPEYQKSQEKVVQLLKAYSRSKGQPSGQNEDPNKKFQTIPVAELATELGECCGILKLEERLQVMVKKSVHLWTAKMKVDYSQYLKIAIEKLGHASKDVEQIVEGDRKLHQQVTTLTDEVTAIWKSVTDATAIWKPVTDDEKSHVYEKLASAYEEDIKAANPAQKGRAEVPALVEEFKIKCKKRMDDKKEIFGQAEFQKDIQTFCSEAEKKLDEVFDSACQLQNVREALLTCAADSAADCSTMRSKAERLRDILPSNTKAPRNEASGNEDLSGITKKARDYRSTECEQPENESHLSTHNTKWLTGGTRAPKTHTPNTAENSSQHGHSESRKTSAHIQQPISTHDASEIPPNERHNEPQNLAELKEKTHIPAVKLTRWKRFCRFVMSFFTRKESEKSSSSGEKQTTPTSDLDPDSAQLSLDEETFEAEFQSLQDSILEECGQYFQTIKNNVVKYYLGLYRKNTQKRLDAVEADFKDDIDEAVQLLKTLKIRIDKEETTAKDLDTLEHHFNSLHNFLNSELFLKVYTEGNVQA